MVHLSKRQDVRQGLSWDMLQQAEEGPPRKDGSCKRGTCLHRSKMRSQLEGRGRSRRPHGTRSERWRVRIIQAQMLTFKEISRLRLRSIVLICSFFRERLDLGADLCGERRADGIRHRQVASSRQAQEGSTRRADRHSRRGC